MSSSLNLSTSINDSQIVKTSDSDPTSPDVRNSPLSSISSSLLSRAIPSDFTESSDSSEESYREKFSHLQILVRQLNKQLQSEKIRRDGVETISRCLTEQRQETERLKDENNELKLTIRSLQSNLASHGVPSSLESDGSSLKRASSVPVGIVDTSTIERLVEENLQLKNEVKYLTIDPQKMESTEQQNVSLRDQVRGLQEKVLALRLDKEALEQTLRSSSNGQLQEIARLRSELDDLREKGVSKDLLCQTLSEQSQTLQQRLRETGALCQQLLQRLETLEPSTSASGGEGTPRSASGGGGTPKSSLQAGLSKLQLSGNSSGQWDQEKRALQQELTGLAQKLDEVVVVNQKWQEYHDKREVEFASLQSRLQQTEEQMRSNTSRLSESQQERIDKLILQYKRQINACEEDKENVLDENRDLRRQVHSLTKTNEKLENQIKGLLEQHRSQSLTGAVRNESPSMLDDMDRAKIQALELQIKVCTEDFESERRDREIAQRKAYDLERELQIYKSQLESFQRGAASRINARRYGNTPGRYQYDYANLDDVAMPEQSSPANLIGRGVYQPDTSDVEGEDTVDMARIHTDGPPTQDNEITAVKTLQCPKCSKTYPGDRHMDLIQHMDGCLK